MSWRLKQFFSGLRYSIVKLIFLEVKSLGNSINIKGSKK